VHRDAQIRDACHGGPAERAYKPTMYGPRSMNALLIRVGADQSVGGGHWNGPLDSSSGRFVYVPIPETKLTQPGLERPYSSLEPHLSAFGVPLPPHLRDRRMHLDPDFEHLTYGDRGRKGSQIAATVKPGDLLVFYAGLRDVTSLELVYALIGLIVIERIDLAREWPASAADRNAHTRRVLSADADDVIVIGSQSTSGRLATCIPIGEYRERAYRVRKDVLTAWGGISANDGYLQRSAVFPSMLAPARFLNWWGEQGIPLVRSNKLER
jgi:hypothetical protein